MYPGVQLVWDLEEKRWEKWNSKNSTKDARSESMAVVEAKVGSVRKGKGGKGK